jgi:hypothetical protein
MGCEVSGSEVHPDHDDLTTPCQLNNQVGLHN